MPATQINLFNKLWKHHPGFAETPCDSDLFRNQCAIRMGVALEGADVDTSAFDVRRCSTDFPALRDHEPGHILGAQELANALARHAQEWPSTSRVQKFTGTMKDNWQHFKAHRGIIFIRNGWGTTDHIDLWDAFKNEMPGARNPYLTRGQQVWFWWLG